MTFISGKSISSYESPSDSTSWNTAGSVAYWTTYPQRKKLEYAPESMCAVGSNKWYFGLGGGSFQYYSTSGVESYDVANINSGVGIFNLGPTIVPYAYNSTIDVAQGGSKAIIAYGSGLSPPVISSFNFDIAYNLGFVSRPAGGNSWATLESAMTSVYITNTANMIFTCNSTHVHKYVANAYNLSSLTYDGSIPVGTTTTNDLYFSADGSKLYTIGSGNDRIYQYNLGTNWNLGTATLYGSYNVSSIDSNPRGLCISYDGLYAYFLGRTNGRIYRLELATAYDITSASYSSNYFSIGTSNGLETGTRIKSTGTHIYYNNGSSAIEVSLPTPFSMIGASKTGINGSLNRRERFSYGLDFSSDGSHMYSGAGRNLNKINITTPWSLSSSYFQEVDESLITIPTSRFNISSDPIYAARYSDSGTKIYILSPREILQYNLGTAYNISTATYSTKKVITTSSTDLYVSDYKVITFSNGLLKSYILTTSEDISSMVPDTSNNHNIYTDSAFIPHGGNEILLRTNYTIDKQSMSSAYVPTTATYKSNSSGWYSETYGATFNPKSLTLSNDGSKMFYMDSYNILYYSLSDSWNVASSTITSMYPTDLEYNTLRVAYDGVNAFLGSSNTIKHIVLTSPYNFTSYTIAETIVLPGSALKSFCLDNHGSKLFILYYDTVYEYLLPDRWNVASYTTTGRAYTLLNGLNATDIIISSTGSYLYSTTANTSSSVNTVQKYTMNSKWDLSTISFDSSFVVKGTNMSIGGIYFRPYGNEYYILDKGSVSIFNLKV